MASWQGVQLNFCKSEVRDTAGRFSSLEAKFFTPVPLKWEHWYCESALSEKLYCPQLILEVLWVKLQIKQGCHCFSQKHTVYGQRGLQCLHALPIHRTLKFKPAASLQSQHCPQPPSVLFHSPPNSPHHTISLHPGPPPVLPFPAPWTTTSQWWHSPHMQVSRRDRHVTFMAWITCACVGKTQTETCVGCLTALHSTAVTFPEQRSSSPPGATEKGEDSSASRWVCGHPNAWLSGVY